MSEPHRLRPRRQVGPDHRRVDRHRRRGGTRVRARRLPRRHPLQRQPEPRRGSRRRRALRRRRGVPRRRRPAHRRRRRAKSSTRRPRTTAASTSSINNAGGLVQRVPIAEIDDAFFDAVIDLNVRSVVAACSAAVPHMRKSGGGNIINVTSIAARARRRRRARRCTRRRRASSRRSRTASRKEARQGQHPRERGVARRDHHAVPRALFDAGDARRLARRRSRWRLGTAEECAGAFLFSRPTRCRASSPARSSR